MQVGAWVLRLLRKLLLDLLLWSGVVSHVYVDLVYRFPLSVSLLDDAWVHVDELVAHVLRSIDDECDAMGDVFYDFRVLLGFAPQVVVVTRAILHLEVASLLRRDVSVSVRLQ